MPFVHSAGDRRSGDRARGSSYIDVLGAEVRSVIVVIGDGHFVFFIFQYIGDVARDRSAFDRVLGGRGGSVCLIEAQRRLGRIDARGDLKIGRDVRGGVSVQDGFGAGRDVFSTVPEEVGHRVGDLGIGDRINDVRGHGSREDGFLGHVGRSQPVGGGVTRSGDRGGNGVKRLAVFDRCCDVAVRRAEGHGVCRLGVDRVEVALVGRDRVQDRAVLTVGPAEEELALDRLGGQDCRIRSAG